MTPQEKEWLKAKIEELRPNLKEATFIEVMNAINNIHVDTIKPAREKTLLSTDFKYF